MKSNGCLPQSLTATGLQDQTRKCIDKVRLKQ